MEQVWSLLLKDSAFFHIIIIGRAVSHKVQNSCSSTDFKHHSTLAWGSRRGGAMLVEEHAWLLLSNPWALRQGFNVGVRNAITLHSLLHCPSSGNFVKPKEKKPLLGIKVHINTESQKGFYPLAWAQFFTMLQIQETLLLLVMVCLLLVSQWPLLHSFLRTLSLTTYISTIHLASPFLYAIFPLQVCSSFPGWTHKWKSPKNCSSMPYISKQDNLCRKANHFKIHSFASLIYSHIQLHQF